MKIGKDRPYTDVKEDLHKLSSSDYKWNKQTEKFVPISMDAIIGTIATAVIKSHVLCRVLH